MKNYGQVGLDYDKKLSALAEMMDQKRIGG